MKRIKCISALLLAAVMTVAFAGCAAKPADGVNQLAEKPDKGRQIATIKVRDYGDIKLMLFPEVAPKAVENFATHSKNGYYDGVKFHRVIEDFMAQSGDPEGTGMGGESIWGEGFGVEYDGRLHHYTGAIGCAQSSLPDSIGSQFYLVDAPPLSAEEMEAVKEANKIYKDNNQPSPYPTDEAVLENYSKVGGSLWLDGGYTVFGQIYEGLDVLNKIMTCEKDAAQLDANGTAYVPVPEIFIDTIEISAYGE